VASKRKAKFKVGQWVAIRGYEPHDTRQAAIVKAIEGDDVQVWIGLGDGLAVLHYGARKLRPLTAREKG